MPSRAEFLHVLESHLGEGEHPPGSEETIFNRFLGIGPGWWCMDFVSTCLWTVGNRDLAGLREARGTSYVPDLYDWAQRHNRIVSWDHAQPGDGVIFVWGEPHSNPHGDHVGVLVSKSPLVTIEGNTHDSRRESRLHDRVMYHHDRTLAEIRAFVRFTLADDPHPHPQPTPPRFPPWPGRILTLRTPWMSGADVRMWQQRLAHDGYSLDVDGIYGPGSEHACRQFQQAHGMVVDGEVGPNTWHATWTAKPHPHPQPQPQPQPQPHPSTRIATGLDRSYPPSRAEARAIRSHTPVAWWGVYIGGHCYAGGWSPAAVRALGQDGYRFLPIYVGQQDRSVCSHSQLTSAQGAADGSDAVQRMHAFGWGPHRNVPVCLDVEHVTFQNNPTGTLEYVAAWSQVVRRSGYRPGVYATGTCLTSLHGRPQEHRPDWVWLASWTRQGHDGSLDPAHAAGLPVGAWSNARAWQYAGDVRHVPGAAGGVDISCSVVELAPPP